MNQTATQSSTTRKCEYCGTEDEKREVPLTGNVIYVRSCKCEQDAYYKRMEEAEKRYEQQKLQDRRDFAGLGERFGGCTFDNWQHHPSTEKAYGTVKKYADSFDEEFKNGRGFILFGSSGIGKTRLLASLTNYLVEKNNHCAFRPVTSLLYQLRSTFNGKGSESKILDELIDVDLLLLDDVGAEKWTEWVESTMYYLIDERYRAQLPIVISSNLNLGQMEDALGFRSLDRVLEICKPIKMDGESFRKNAARSRAKDF